MESSVVHLNRPPHSARLVAWGRAPDAWWACITWRQRVRNRDGQPDEIDFAAWVPSSAVSRPPWSQPVDLPRVSLSPDRRTWPAPPGWPSWYAGVWTGGPVAVPVGVEMINGPAWRQ